MIALDFETLPIGPRPARFPPKPIGLAFRLDGHKPGYYAFGHSHSGNTPDARYKSAKLLHEAWSGKHGVVMMHNAPFDIEVAMTHFGLPGFPKSWCDTVFLAFLNNPREAQLRLKPLAKKYLRHKLDGKSELDEWIIENLRDCSNPNRPRKITPSKTGEYIYLAPGKLVAKYAEQDAEMTASLARKLGTLVHKRSARMISESLAREVKLAPITMRMEQSGVRVDVRRLKNFAVPLEKLFNDLSDDIVRRLGGRNQLGAEFNPSSGPQLAHALNKAGKLREKRLTPTGRQATSMPVLVETCNDAKLIERLHLYSVAEKYLGGFVRPWIASAERNDGYINPRFNQVRSTEAGYGGTRTGRYSSQDPNLQQVPSDIAESKNGTILIKFAEMLALPDYGVQDFPGLRDFFIPDAGAMWVSLDYNQQELHILAHFEKGALMAAYLANPTLDVHAWIKDIIRQKTGIDWPRKAIKTVVFGLLYGMGKAKLARALGLEEEAASQLRDDILDVLPGVRNLMYKTKGTIETWGGRIYDVEPTRVIGATPDGDGIEIDYAYKQLNTLIQGSAADCTKQGMLNIHESVPNARIALQVHDELVLMAHSMRDVERATEAMCAMNWNVPMTTKPKISKQSWARAA